MARSVEHEAVAVDCLEAARTSLEILHASTGEALGEREAVRADELDSVAGFEAALAVGDAHCEQAGSLLGDRPAGSGVDMQAPRDRLPEPRPAASLLFGRYSVS